MNFEHLPTRPLGELENPSPLATLALEAMQLHINDVVSRRPEDGYLSEESIKLSGDIARLAETNFDLAHELFVWLGGHEDVRIRRKTLALLAPLTHEAEVRYRSVYTCREEEAPQAAVLRETFRETLSEIRRFWAQLLLDPDYQLADGAGQILQEAVDEGRVWGSTAAAIAWEVVSVGHGSPFTP